MESYVVRVWLPDRPGALGAVASRIGAVKGDVVGIEILETGEGQAVDELVVTIPEATLVDLLVSEIRQVDGVEVEEVRPVGPAGHDPRRDTLVAAVELVAAANREELMTMVRDHAPRALSATWVALVDVGGGSAVVTGDTAPSEAWIRAFVNGAPEALPGVSGQSVSDVIAVSLDGVGLAVVAGRDRIGWRDRERQQLEALAQLIALRWAELPDS